MNPARRRVLRGLLALSALVSGLPLAASGAGRLVSVGGSVTETVFALGAADQLVGVDTSSIYPESARELPKVGYQRVLSAEGILSLRPTLLLSDEQAGPATVIQQLRAAGLPVQTVPTATTGAAVSEKILLIGRTLNRDSRAEQLARRVAHQLRSVALALTGREPGPKVLLLLAHGRGSPLGAGSDTQAEAMIHMAGGQNALRGFRGYKPVSPEAVVAAAPEVIVLPEQSLQSLGGLDAALATSGLSATPAARDGRIVVLDMLYLLGMGPRTGDAVNELVAAFHPGLETSVDA